MTGAITQLRAWGPMVGQPYGSFSGKTGTDLPVDRGSGYTIPGNQFHYDVPPGPPHYTIPDSQKHYTLN